jgi:hypothetical protein
LERDGLCHHVNPANNNRGLEPDCGAECVKRLSDLESQLSANGCAAVSIKEEEKTMSESGWL